MPYRITFALDLPADQRQGLESLAVLFDALVETDVLHLRAKGMPSGEQAKGIRREAIGTPGYVEWRDIPTILRTGGADPVSLAAWAVAGARLMNLPPPTAMVTDALRELTKLYPSRITFALDLFRVDSDRKLSQAVLNVLLRALFAADVLYLKRNPNTPRIYEVPGLLYMEEPPGSEEWQDPGVCIRMGRADCEDVACWRAAELLVRDGIRAQPFFREARRPDGGYLYHILVALPDGRVEDPSKILGMR